MDVSGNRPLTITGRWLWGSGWLVLICGLCLHLTIRDRLDPLAVAFYALPLPVLGALAVALCCWEKWRIIAVLTALLVFALWVSRSWCWSEIRDPSSSATEFRAMYWNLGRPKAPSKDLIQLVKQLQPDVVGCGEPGPDFMQHGTSYENALPGYTCHLMPRGLILLSRWPVKMVQRGKLDSIGAFACFDVDAPQGTVRLVLVDVWADPLLPRRRSLDESLAHAEGKPRSIVMGDFNTPAESVWFVPYREGMRDGFEAAGRGFRETWFWRLPILSLDHVWASKDWQVTEAKKLNLWSSDHAALFVRLTQAPQP